MTLAFGVTIDSVPNSIGNPQNLLIVIKDTIPVPFISFLKILFIRDVLNLAIIYLFIYFVHRKIIDEPIAKPIPASTHDYQTTIVVKIGFAIMLLVLGIKMMMEFANYSLHLNFGYIALIVTTVYFLLTYRIAPESNLLTLAAGSTIADNLSILGAVSTIIIIQNAENRNIKCFGFFEFIKLGLPLTMINIMIYAYLM